MAAIEHVNVLKKTTFKGCVKNIVTNFDTLSLYGKFLFIMSSSEVDIISIVYVDTCFDIRKGFHDCY